MRPENAAYAAEEHGGREGLADVTFGAGSSTGVNVDRRQWSGLSYALRP